MTELLFMSESIKQVNHISYYISLPLKLSEGETVVKSTPGWTKRVPRVK